MSKKNRNQGDEPTAGAESTEAEAPFVPTTPEEQFANGMTVQVLSQKTGISQSYTVSSEVMLSLSGPHKHSTTIDVDLGNDEVEQLNISVLPAAKKGAPMRVFFWQRLIPA